MLLHWRLLLLVIFISAFARSANTPPDACIAVYSGATSSQRSASFVLVPNNTFVLQAIPASAAARTVLLPSGFNYSLASLIVALDATMPWSNTTAAVELSFYQVRNSHLRLRTSCPEYLPFLSLVHE